MGGLLLSMASGRRLRCASWGSPTAQAKKVSFWRGVPPGECQQRSHCQGGVRGWLSPAITDPLALKETCGMWDVGCGE